MPTLKTYFFFFFATFFFATFFLVPHLPQLIATSFCLSYYITA